jgi:putative membrane protein
MPTPRTHILLIGATSLAMLLALSGTYAYSRTTWALEVFPVAIALMVLFATHRRFPLTSLLYWLIFVHALVLILGGAYTYARVPFGFYLAELLGLTRNPYDKIGHFFQGLVPALAAREILLRCNFIQRGKMLVFLVLCVVLAISAAYELLEWASAIILGQGADEFLGTQGDPWDTQSDMFFAFMGGSTSIAIFSFWHDRQINKLPHNQKGQVQ